MSGENAHILVVDDEPKLRALLSRFLSENGFRVTMAESAAEARDKLRFMDFDLMVLDVMMPGENGLELTGDLRGERAPSMPILLLTARGAPEDIIAGFEAGADDYLGKPFDPRILLARIRAMLRRAQPPATPAGPLQLGPAVFDSARAELVGPNSRIRLTGAELALLMAFAARPHEILSRETLASVLGLDDVNERAIDVQVTRLRRKIEADPREPRFLHTVRGKGYILKPGRMKLRLGGFSIDRVLRRVLPRTLLGRSLLIVLIPLVLVQVVALQIFYGSHLDELSRRLAGGVAGEVGFMIDEVNRAPITRGLIIQESDAHFGFQTVFLRDQVLRHLPRPDAPGPVDTDLAAELGAALHRPFTVDWNTQSDFIRVSVQMADGVMRIDVPRKRLYVGTFYLFLIWLIGTAGLLFGVAALFLRNQVRGIKRLAAAAEAFGRGRDPGPIRPEGAIEVRRAASAFNRMQERVRRFLAQRTTMLAGVSHDLRTPLTRLRLALAMLPGVPPEDMADMTGDIEEMERLIGIYLSFARGEGSEQAVRTDILPVLEEVVAAARRSGACIECDVREGVAVTLRPEAMRRALTNLVDNARRHAAQIWISLARQNNVSVRIYIDDNGPGIPLAQRETLFRPFESADPGGTGLGLAIARDIIGAHGGDILLLDRPGGGLRVVVELPA